MKCKVAATEELKNGAMLSVEANGDPYVIFRDDSGQIFALVDRCSHAEVRLSEGEFSDHEVTCVAHGARFNVTNGKALCMPAITPVKTIVVSVEDGNIFLELSE